MNNQTKIMFMVQIILLSKNKSNTNFDKQIIAINSHKLILQEKWYIYKLNYDYGNKSHNIN